MTKPTGRPPGRQTGTRFGATHTFGADLGEPILGDVSNSKGEKGSRELLEALKTQHPERWQDILRRGVCRIDHIAA